MYVFFCGKSEGLFIRQKLTLTYTSALCAPTNYKISEMFILIICCSCITFIVYSVPPFHSVCALSNIYELKKNYFKNQLFITNYKKYNLP